MGLVTLAGTGQQQPTWVYAVVFGGLVLVALFFWCLHRLSPSKRTHTAIGNALLHIETMFRPTRERIIEAREHEELELDEEGEPPETGGRHL